MYTRQNKNTIQNTPSPVPASVGQKSIVLNDNRERSVVQQKTISGNGTIQLKPLEKMVTGITHLVRLVNGSLYNKNYTSNEVAPVTHGDQVIIDTDVRYRSRRGPNQEVAQNNAEDEQGPQHYLWYKVLSVNGRAVGDNIFIREDTITHPEQENALQHPLDHTIHGTDEASDNEIRDAYSEGQRDFDCAYSYHKGKTYLLFRSFRINHGPVRLIYKFKWEELAGATKEIEQFTRTPGVILHTIMLHELPGDANLRKAIRQLAFFGKMYHCHIGVSNVDITRFNLDSDLPRLVQQFRQLGIPLSVVENRMNPAVPDALVRDYCYRNGIKYLAYGLSGPSGVGTCGLVPGGQGDYKYLEDPEMENIAHHLGITVQQFRHVVYTWARRQHVNVITRSSQPDRRAQNRQNVNFGHQEQRAINYFAPTASPIYGPYLQYLQRQGVSGGVLHQLPNYIHSNWLELYYKKVVVELHEDPLLELLKGTFDLLVNAPGKNRWEDLTKMRDWIGKVLTGEPIIDPPQRVSAAALIQYYCTENKFKIYDGDYKEYTTTEALNQLPRNTELTITKGDSLYKYKVTQPGEFTFER